MDTLFGEMCKLDKLFLGGQSQLEPRGAQAEPEERREIYCRTLTYTERAFGPSNSHRKIAW